MSQLDMNQLLARLLDPGRPIWSAEADVIANQEKPSPSRPTRANSVNTRSPVASRSAFASSRKAGSVSPIPSPSTRRPWTPWCGMRSMRAASPGGPGSAHHSAAEQAHHRLRRDTSGRHHGAGGREDCPDPAPRVRHAGPAGRDRPYNGFFEGSPPLKHCQQRGQPLRTSGVQRRLPQLPLSSSGRPPVHALPGTVRTALRRLESQPLIRQIHAVADGLLMGEAVPSGRYSVIFSTHCFASLFGCFQSALSGKVGPAGSPLARQAGPKRGFSLAHPGESCLYAGGMKIRRLTAKGPPLRISCSSAGGAQRPCCTTAPPPATSA